MFLSSTLKPAPESVIAEIFMLLTVLNRDACLLLAVLWVIEYKYIFIIVRKVVALALFDLTNSFGLLRTPRFPYLLHVLLLAGHEASFAR